MSFPELLLWGLLGFLVLYIFTLVTFAQVARGACFMCKTQMRPSARGDWCPRLDCPYKRKRRAQG